MQYAAHTLRKDEAFSKAAAAVAGDHPITQEDMAKSLMGDLGRVKKGWSHIKEVCDDDQELNEFVTDAQRHHIQVGNPLDADLDRVAGEWRSGTEADPDMAEFFAANQA